MAVQREEKFFKSTSKANYNVRYLIWKDTSVKPVAVVQIAHGVQEHIERYDEFACFLASHGYVVCGNDHLGHGKTAGLEALGVTPNDGAKKMVTDMHKLYGIMHKKYSSLPYIVFGHSLGSYIARCYTVKYGKELSGVIYSGSCFIPSFGVVLQPIMKINAIINGAESTDPTVTKTMAKLFNAGIKFPKTQSDWLSFNRDNINNYINDPYCGGDMSASLSRDAISVITSAGKRGWQNKIPKHLPVMIVSGTNDSCGLFGYGTSLLYTQLIKADIDTTYKLYKARHEVLNDDVKQEAFDDILNWLQTKIHG